MAGDLNMNADEEKTPTGWAPRAWVAVRRGFGLLPRMYWWYAMGCVAVFSVAWISPDGSAFGHPKTFVDLRFNEYYTKVVGKNLFGINLFVNCAYWLVVFAIPLPVVHWAKWRHPDWSDSAAVAFRYLVAVSALMLILEPINWGCLMILETVMPMVMPKIYWIRLERLVDPTLLIQTIVLWILVIFMVWGIFQRLWNVLPLIARWIVPVAFFVFLFSISELVIYWDASHLSELRGLVAAKWSFAWCLVPLFLIDCLATFLCWRVRCRRALG